MAAPKSPPSRSARPRTKKSPATSPSGMHGAHGPHAAHGPHGPSDPAERAKILARLRTVEGHLRGILQMVESDAYCIDVLRQTKAVQAAIARIESALLERHLEHCVSRAIRSDDATERTRVIGEIVEVFEAARRG